MLHHKVAKPGERLRYSVVGADRENIGHRTYTVGTFPLARGDGDATLSTGPSSTQKTLLLLHDVCVKTYRNTRETKRQAFLLRLKINVAFDFSGETSREYRIWMMTRLLSLAENISLVRDERKQV